METEQKPDKGKFEVKVVVASGPFFHQKQYWVPVHSWNNLCFFWLHNIAHSGEVRVPNLGQASLPKENKMKIIGLNLHHNFVKGKTKDIRKKMVAGAVRKFVHNFVKFINIRSWNCSEEGSEELLLFPFQRKNV